MEKEQIVSTIQEKLGNTSFSTRSLNDYVERNLPTDGTEPDDAYWDKHIGILKSFQGNASADIANIINTQMSVKAVEYFVKNPDKFKEFMKNHPEMLSAEPPKPTEQPSVDPRIQALEDKYNKLLADKEKADKDNAIQSIRNAVKSKATELKVNRISVWEDATDKVPVVEGETIDTYLEKVKTQYTSDLKRYFGDGEKAYQSKSNPASGSGGNKVVNDYFARKKTKMGIK